ncbi:MAG: HAMP domain-containing histidine kinase [Oscillospiraceae bacterium]|nr:HAMP domain-containing histidine kinase [Oscillospiraceae bacterium]
MKLLRNPELKWELAALIGLTAALALLGLLLVSPLCSLLILAAGGGFCGVHLWFARRRYRRMEELSQEISRVLHGQTSVLISESDEGELAVLRSELQKMTVRLREQSDLLQADKLRLTEAIEDIFHQLRTPLTTMNLVASLLREEELTYPRRAQLVRELRRQLERTDWLVETLLKLSKIDAGTARFRADRVSVRAAIDQAAEPLHIPLELRGQTLTIDAKEECFTGDLSWTAEALSNLLKNCMEHTPAGGAISVTARETALFTEIAVEDNGPGFDREDLPHLFERFYKGKDAGEGSIGIGLALSRSIVAAQNGTIRAANASGGGARFTVRFYKSVV